MHMIGSIKNVDGLNPSVDPRIFERLLELDHDLMITGRLLRSNSFVSLLVTGDPYVRAVEFRTYNVET